MNSSRGHRRRIVAAALTVLTLVLCIAPAAANPRVRRQIERINRGAMSAYDELDYEAAKKRLAEAIVMAKRNQLSRDPVVAQIHINLGIVYFSGFKDRESARIEFINAVEIDPAIEIDPAYRTGEMEALLAEIKEQLGAGGGERGGRVPGGGDERDGCEGIDGLKHELVMTARPGVKRGITVQVSPALKADEVALFYRPQGASDFSRTLLVQDGDCTYRGTIPARAMRGEFMHYYVAAVDGRGRILASKGTSGSPNVVELAATGEASDDENPLSGGDGAEEPADEPDQDVEGRVRPASSSRSFFLGFAVGTGGGLVGGLTEQQRHEVQCSTEPICMAPALFHVLPEIGYFLSPRLTLSAAFRFGFPLGANIDGHSVAAPAGLGRLRYALRPDGVGMHLHAALGGGVLRSTVRLAEEIKPGQDTDIVATGPLLLGAGGGYVFPLGASTRLVAELNAVAGIPLGGSLGCPGSTSTNGQPPPLCFNFGVQLDANLGVLFLF
jgi:hypothetical protein